MLIPVSGHIKREPSFNISHLRVSDPAIVWPAPVSTKSVTEGPHFHCYSSVVHITMVNGSLNSSPTECCLLVCLCLLDILCHNIYIGLGLPYWMWMQLLCPVCLGLARPFEPLPSSQMHSQASLTPVWSAAARVSETPLILWAPVLFRSERQESQTQRNQTSWKQVILPWSFGAAMKACSCD